MAYGLVAHNASAGASTFTSGAIDTSGASLLVVVVTEATAGGATLTDSKSNTWTKLTEQSAVAPACVIYYAKNPTVGSGHTVTLTGVLFFGVASFSAWSGAETSAPFDQENGTGGGSFTNTAQPGSVTPSVDNELVITGFAWNNNQTMSSVTGCTLLDQTDFSGGNNYGGGAAYVIQTTAGAVNPTWNFSGTTAGDIVIATFKASAGITVAQEAGIFDAQRSGAFTGLMYL